MSTEASELRAEVLALRAEVANLRVIVERQGEALRELQFLTGFEVVANESTAAEPQTRDTLPAAGPFVNEAASSELKSGSDWTRRTQVAKEIGRFLRAGLEGRTIDSGRSKVSLKNCLYILARDKDGKDYTRPARIFRSWRGIRPFVEHQGRVEGRLGHSVFIGLPSQREAIVACSEAGLEWPSQIEP